ncbi:type IV toxin-antitoxin system AbiEi family antitoxin domain-containing protein [Microlunatus capsulatus]|uniref:Very-short-patch-repair endonuclease n=1 Tax=Microlunatus capsulatus TaxID=99117 RepID=A0ABS4ZCS5_9ACTN|nr:type IV toxin-antitoxin system AbiEi family antitoxin domain-containing protein [Microlunatus capsulatus]MBP2418821.1 very-short-patch-repair endonuclease [Microlunatus capsulatus]
MLPRQDPSSRLLTLAAGQAGVLLSEQVQDELGRPALRRLVDQGRWRRLDRSVYFTAAGEPPWLAWAWAGVLLGGPGSRLGGTAAAHLHGLLPEPPQRIRVLVPAHLVLRSREPWQFSRERPGVRSHRAGGSPPRTSVPDTVLDLCDRASAAGAIGWVTAAVQERRTTVPLLRDALLQRRRARHRELLTDLLADVAAGAETPLEVRYLRDVERAHGLPVAERQQRSGTHAYVRDVLYRAFGTVVELDGRLGHEGVGRFRDMVRDNRTLLAGEVTLRFGAVDVYEQRCLVARQVAAVLQQRGWDGRPVPCRPHCAVIA